MPQPGEILHLYVEVRSVPGEAGNGRNVEELATVAAPQMDALTSPMATSESSHPWRGAGHIISPTKSSSRHTISLRIHSPADSLNASALCRQSLPYDGMGQLLSPVPHPGTNGARMLTSTCSSICGPCKGNDLQPSLSFVRTSAPGTPSGEHRSPHGAQEVEGRRSVVTFSYIEKAAIKTVESQQSACCKDEPANLANPLHRLNEDRPTSSHPRKRQCNPIWLNSPDSSSGSSPKLTYRGSEVNSPDDRRATINAIGRAATQRALEEFGSPQLRRRVAAGLDSPIIGHQQYPRCQSWAGSPALMRGSNSLPGRYQTDKDKYAYSSPRSLAKDLLTCHIEQSPSTTLASAIVGYQVCASPQQWSKPESQRLSCDRIRAPVSAGERPDSVLPDFIPSSFLGSSGSLNLTQRPNVHSMNLPSELGGVKNQLNCKKSVSPAKSPDVARKLAEEATRMSAIFVEARRSSSPITLRGVVRSEGQPQSPGCVYREGQLGQHQTEMYMQDVEATQRDTNAGVQQQKPDLQGGGIEGSTAIPSRMRRFDPNHGGVNSPLRDPRLQRADILVTYSPTLHRHQPPQYTGGGWSPSLERRSRYEAKAWNSLDTAKRIYLGEHGGVGDTVSPVSWTSRQHSLGMSEGGGDSPRLGFHVDHGASSPVSLQKQAEWRRREALLLGPVMLSVDTEELAVDMEQFRAPRTPGHHGALLEVEERQGSSGSSSRVTSSLGDSDCISPESDQSSPRSNETGHANSGVQSDSGVSSVGSSLHSQKIARAKWEFLFGPPPEESASKAGQDAATAPPCGNSSESPTPVPPTSLPLAPVSQRLVGHDVQHVEVELVTPPPAVAGASPKTGIIRHTVKYSETDLDTVPMRCYRETDIDEVLAEREENDSAFGSNRSVPGTSAAGSSPLGVRLYEHTDEEEELGGEEDDDDDEEEEEVADWASVRMHGDRRRQQASREEDEVFSLLLKRPLDSSYDYHSALKSPILVRGPQRPSEDGQDTFSRHFESIVESHRAKGTSYCSLDSVGLLTSSSQTVFSFDLPTLTPEIKAHPCQSARHIVRMSFAPLARSEWPSLSDSDATRAPSSERLSSASEGTPSRGDLGPVESWNEAPSISREKPARLTNDSDPELDPRERPGQGSTDTLTNGNRADLEGARRLAKRLFHLDGFRKSDVARHLSKNNDFSHMVAEEYLSFFNFSGLGVDQALRAFLKEFALMGETQERERVLSHFSRRYLHCNPNSGFSEDSVHTLTCALMLLNTDLHGHNVGKRMSCSQFIGNLEGMNGGLDFSKELLKALYNSIKNEKLQWTIDEEELRKSFSELGDGCTGSASRAMKRGGGGGNALKGVAPQPGALVYKNGFLVRKVHADSDGKRTPRGKRGWKTFYAVLKGLVLYLQKGEGLPEKQLTEEDLKNAVSIHHSLAMRAADYSKRPNVFYLRTADWRVFLFQAPNAEQMQSWITRINTVAAMFSAPPFPAAIGSQKKFSRPLLPASSSKLSQEEQVQSHEARFRTTSTELAELRSYPPDRKVKGRELEEYRQRSEYLEFEKTRYGTYAMLLRSKIRCGEEDLSVFESQIFEESGLQRAPSSPTLQQDSSQASSTKVGKHSEGQRHSYRQAIKK